MTVLHGTINKISETVEVGKNAFKKRELWLALDDSDPERKQFCSLEATFEMIETLDDFSVGDAVVAHYVLGGRIWEGGQEPRCFNSLRLTSIQTLADRDTHQDEAENLPF